VAISYFLKKIKRYVFSFVERGRVLASAQIVNENSKKGVVGRE
jgi:hypothetical protein